MLMRLRYNSSNNNNNNKLVYYSSIKHESKVDMIREDTLINLAHKVLFICRIVLRLLNALLMVIKEGIRRTSRDIVIQQTHMNINNKFLVDGVRERINYVGFERLDFIYYMTGTTCPHCCV